MDEEKNIKFFLALVYENQMENDGSRGTELGLEDGHEAGLEERVLNPLTCCEGTRSFYMSSEFDQYNPKGQYEMKNKIERLA